MIIFEPLSKEHFVFLYQWLNEPHVRKWWGEEKEWAYEDIVKKYTSYAQGHKIEQGLSKPIYGFVISINHVPVGYIQYYNAYDFEREGYSLKKELYEFLPKSLAALDFYIGNPAFLGKGLGVLILSQFLKEHVFKYFKACVLDPDLLNVQAIKTYEKVGFEKRELMLSKGSIFMIKYAGKGQDV